MLDARCPSKQQLADCVHGILQEEEAERILRHVDSCAICEATADVLARVQDRMLEAIRESAQMSATQEDRESAEVITKLESIDLAEFAAAPLGDVELDLPQPERDVPDDLIQLHEYRLLKKLGQGGMGTVYKAIHTKLDKVVAVKVLLPSGKNDRARVERFRREMKVVAQFEHPNIIRATDAGEQEEVHFLVMEYIRGIDLSKLVKQHGPLSVADACEIVRQAAFGLHYAHSQGMIHRDVKPSNLMLTVETSDFTSIDAPAVQRGVVKLLDMGLVRVEQALASFRLTGDRQLLGTADYMAPEQAEDSHEVTPATDIYSLGCTLYCLLTGRAPFGDPSHSTLPQKIKAHAERQPDPISVHRSGVPHGLAEIIERMLAKKSADRFPTAAEVVSALTVFAQGQDIGALCEGVELQ